MSEDARWEDVTQWDGTREGIAHLGKDVIWQGREVEFYGIDREWLRDVELEFQLVFWREVEV